MNVNNGWVKLHRKITEWEWYRDANVFRVFTHLVLTANHEERKWMGKTIVKGSRVCSYGTLAEETGLSVQNVRTAITKLKSTGELTSKSNNKYTVISIINYSTYQEDNKQTNKRLTNHQQATNNKQELKNIRSKENIYIEIISFFNEVMGKKLKVVDEKAVDYWTKLYSLEEIKQAIERIPGDPFWKDKMDLTLLFRRKNPQGEAVDYIGQLINREKKLVMKRFDTL